LSLYSDRYPPELESLVLVRIDRVDNLGIWGSLPDWGDQFKAYLPLGAVGRQRGKGERRAQAHFVTRARRFCAKGQPLDFVGYVQSVEQTSCSATDSLDIGSVGYHVTVSRRGVTDEEEAATMELSREMHCCADRIVDEAANRAKVPREWARQVTLFNAYHRSLQRLDADEDENEDEGIPPERAALDLLLNVIGNLNETGVPEVLSLLGLSDESSLFVQSLLPLCRHERLRRSKPIVHSVTASIGGQKEDVVGLVKEARSPQFMADFAAVASALSSVSSVAVPSGCEPVCVSVSGSGKYTFSTLAPPGRSESASLYLELVAAQVQKVWHEAVTGESAGVDGHLDSRKPTVESCPSSPMQPSLNIGMIGDVAHGKSTAVKAMTGKRTQSHSKEQQQHGITIRLGFANAAILRCQGPCCGACSFLPESKDKPKSKLPPCSQCEGPTSVVTRVSFVDCPGHAELMATMLSGASTFDVVLFAAASNVPCPTPQAKQHLLAVKMSGVLDGTTDNVAIVQTKSELASSSVSALTPAERLKRHAVQGKKSLRKHLGRNAPCFPVCAPLDVGLDSLAEWIATRATQQQSRKEADDGAARLVVLRSFDVNRPGQDVDRMVGGVVGGAIVGSGSIAVGDTLEIRPGLHVGGASQRKKGKKGDDSDPFAVQPLLCKCTSLMSGKTELASAAKGGLIAVGTTICPSYTAENGLVGSVVGRPGTLPPVWGPTLQLDTIEFVQLDKLSSKDLLRKGSQVRCHVGSATVSGTVVRISAKRKRLEVSLQKPLCGSGGVAIEARSSSGGYTIAAHGRISGGDCSVEGVDEMRVADQQGDKSGTCLDFEKTESGEDDDGNESLEGGGDDARRVRFLEALEAADGTSEKSGPAAISLPKPKIERDGKAHMVVSNFGLLVTALRRDPRHLIRFLETEGGLTCTLGGTVTNVPATSLRVAWRGGRGFSERFISIVKRYATAYVSCLQCRGAVTELRGRGTTCELFCRKCNASRFVPKL